MQTLTDTPQVVSIMTGSFQWGFTREGSTGPEFETVSELVLWQRPSAVPLGEDIRPLINDRIPQASRHETSTRLGRHTIRGTLEIVPCETLPRYERYSAEYVGLKNRAVPPLKIGEHEWHYTGHASITSDVNIRSGLPTLPDLLAQFPDVTPLNPGDLGAQFLVTLASNL